MKSEKSRMPDAAPKISVVMAFHNEKDHISEAINSIVEQDFTDWELILIDDGSTDDGALIAQAFSLQDGRIRVLRTGVNLGLPACLNVGIAMASGDFIARADADDISLPNRFSTQYDFLSRNLDIDIVGSGAFLIDESDDRKQQCFLREGMDEIKEQSFRSTIFIHPSVMIRRDFFERVGLYDVSLRRSQEKELWLRGIANGCVYHNLPICLIEYRTNNYKKSLKVLLQKFLAGLTISDRYSIPNGRLIVLIVFLRSLSIKFGIYRPLKKARKC